MIGLTVRPKKTIGTLSPRVARAMKQVAKRVKLSWKALARHRLHTTYAAYTAGIQSTESRGAPVIRLVGKWPQAIETGFGPYSLRQVLLRSPKARRTLAIKRKATALQQFKARIAHRKVPQMQTLQARYIIVPIQPRAPGATAAGTSSAQTGKVRFRTVGQYGIGGKGWRHPGYRGVKLIPKLKKDLPEIIRQEMSKEFGRR